MAGLTLANVVKVDVMLRDVWDIPVMEEVFKRRFQGQYRARKTISTEFAHRGGPGGLKVQIDGIAYRSKAMAAGGTAQPAETGTVLR